MLAKSAAFLPSRAVQQRMPAQGGWSEGDASFVGDNPPGGATITYYQRARHLYGPIKIEVLDAAGKLVDHVSPSKRRGINRVTWAMQVNPPRVPRAAQVAFSSSQGPRVLPGTYTVRLTKGTETIETKLTIALDRRAPYTPAERKQQFDAVMRAHELFGDMSVLCDRLDAAREAAAAREQAVGTDPLAKKLAALSDKLAEVKKKIVATKEGGAITGEERIREHLDILYGALMQWEGKPAKYQLERIDALTRELADAKAELEAVAQKDVAPLNEELAKKKLEPIPTASPARAEREEEESNPPTAAAFRCILTRGADCAEAAARENDRR